MFCLIRFLTLDKSSCESYLLIFMRCCQCLNFISTITGDMLDEPTAIVEGYNSYFSFSKKRSGYSGKIKEVLHVFTEVLLKR